MLSIGMSAVCWVAQGACEHCRSFGLRAGTLAGVDLSPAGRRAIGKPTVLRPQHSTGLTMPLTLDPTQPRALGETEQMLDGLYCTIRLDLG
jgi:hypothetical protein